MHKVHSKNKTLQEDLTLENGKLIIISNSDPLPIEIPISLSILEDGQLGDINIDGLIITTPKKQS